MNDLRFEIRMLGSFAHALLSFLCKLPPELPLVFRKDVLLHGLILANFLVELWLLNILFNLIQFINGLHRISRAWIELQSTLNRLSRAPTWSIA